MNDGMNYLTIALTTDCNCKCSYCKSKGESMSKYMGTQNFSELRRYLKVAYDLGINSFRITGGEPTTVDYLADLMHYIMDLGHSTRIRLNTNGYKLDKFIDTIKRYNNRIEVIISVDSLYSNLNGIFFHKYLSETLKSTVLNLIRNEILTRFNIVITKNNIKSVPELINYSLTLGVNIKLLDLNLQEEYIGDKDSYSYWKKLYVPLGELKKEIPQIVGEKLQYMNKYNQWISTGIPMDGFIVGKQTIQIKDSSNGAKYSRRCIEECNYYSICKEGIFSPFLSVGGVLHLSGCKNENIYYYLAGKTYEEIKMEFIKILQLFNEI